MKHPICSFPSSPPALGPYSLGVIAEGRFIFVSGMTPYDPERGAIYRGTIAEQTELVLKNVGGVLNEAGAGFSDVVSCRVYLSSLTPENFAEMNRVYTRFFGESKPARVTIGAQLLGFDVEIECVALVPPSA